MGAIIRRVRLHAEISRLTMLGAVRFYVLLGLTFTFECAGEFGPRPFFTAHAAGTHSDYTYFSFTTMPTWATATSRPGMASVGPWR